MQDLDAAIGRWKSSGPLSEESLWLLVELREAALTDRRQELLWAAFVRGLSEKHRAAALAMLERVDNGEAFKLLQANRDYRDSQPNYNVGMTQESRGVLATWKTYIDSLAGESDRGVALAMAAAFEDQTRSILQAFMVTSKETDTLLSGPLASFSVRISACHALALISDEERNSLTVIREIRNHFAHQWARTTFDVPQIESRCRRLPVRQLSESGAARDHFISAAGELLFHLIERNRQVTKPQAGWWITG